MKNLDAPALALIDACSQASLELLQRNLTPHGILAASRTDAAVARRYTRIFGRDAAICVMAMCGSGVPALEQGAVASLDALAAQQAANGQIPKYVDPEGRDADFWYLGCIDATLWWLIAVDHVRRHGRVGARALAAARCSARIGWLLAQEHQHFRLLQQNEASDWADIMPRSGYRALHQHALVRGQAPLRAGPCGGDASPLQPPVQPLPARAARVPPGAAAAALCAPRPARPRAVPELRQSLGRRPRRATCSATCWRSRPAWPIPRWPTASSRHSRGECQRALSGARGAASADAPAPAVAAVHGAPPAEPRAPVPQRRHLALRRRLLGDDAGAAGAARAGLVRTRAAGARERSSTTGASPSGSTAARWRRWGWPARAGMPRPSCSPGAPCWAARPAGRRASANPERRSPAR